MLTFHTAPRISAVTFAAVLARHQSPALEEAQLLATIPGAYGLDRAVALAFFFHESSLGTAGVCATHQTRNWGNLRRIQRLGAGVVIATPRGRFARYPTWAAGLDDWCLLIVNRYVGRGLDAVPSALEIYAPSSDGNTPARYAAAVAALVAGWQAEEEGGCTPRRMRVLRAANVREGRGIGYPVALGGRCVLPRGAEVLIDDTTAGWAHLADHRGFVAAHLLEEV